MYIRSRLRNIVISHLWQVTLWKIDKLNMYMKGFAHIEKRIASSNQTVVSGLDILARKDVFFSYRPILQLIEAVSVTRFSSAPSSMNVYERSDMDDVARDKTSKRLWIIRSFRIGGRLSVFLVKFEL